MEGWEHVELFQGFWGCLAVEVAACALLWKFPGFPSLWSTTIDRKNGLAPVVQELIESKLKDEEWERHGHTRGLQGQIPAKTREKRPIPWMRRCWTRGFVCCCNWENKHPENLEFIGI